MHVEEVPLGELVTFFVIKGLRIAWDTELKPGMRLYLRPPKLGPGLYPMLSTTELCPV